ncbi:MAG: LysM peptidoglycan-binding domain-containing protein [Oceanihabitans sp.]
MKILFLPSLLFFTAITFGQSNVMSPIIVDGKPAFINTNTGEIVYNSEAVKESNNISKTISNNDAPSEIAQNHEHLVVKGETLFAIAKKYKTSVAVIKEKNNLVTNTIKVGQLLFVDTSNMLAEANKTYITIEKNNTLYSIAKNNQTTVSKLKTLNNLQSNIIRIGQKLQIQ